MSVFIHKNCNVEYAQIAVGATGMSFVETGVNQIKMSGSEKHLDQYKKAYKTEASRHGMIAITGEFLVDGRKMVCVL